jgi:flagellar protein FlbT
LVPLYGSTDRTGGALISSFTDTWLKNSIENIGYFRSLSLVYQPLTSIGKDCGASAKTPLAPICRDQAATHSHCPDGSRGKRYRRTDMALKVELKPHERIIIGAAVITNTDQRARLLIDGDNIPILREKDILTPETADTPAKLIYLAVQLMYISPDPQVNHGTYFNLVRDIVTAAPSTWPIIEEINTYILSGKLYQALKEARKLVAYEKTLLDLNRTHNAEAAAAHDADTERRSA